MPLLYDLRDLSANGLSAYWAQSTAPLNVDGLTPADSDPPEIAKLPEKTVANIVDDLLAKPNPHLVIETHGFNNSQEDAFARFTAAVQTISTQDLTASQNTVYIGYRWPGEKMGAPSKTAFSALPGLLKFFLPLGLIVALALWIGSEWTIAKKPGSRELLEWGVGFLPAAAALVAFAIFPIALRVLVYFRDAYRALNYGVPDLVEIVRDIGSGLDQSKKLSKRVKLSFIGHSMGAFVVTTTIRILCDVFAAGAIGTPAVDAVDMHPSGYIDNAFELENLVLVSPDITADTLVMGRSNFLASALRRFKEAYLFSNEGDVVVGMIATIANYFSYPNMTGAHGTRLADVNIRTGPKKQEFGIIGYDLNKVYAGRDTLVALNGAIKKARSGSPPAPKSKTDSGLSVPSMFSYIDCTDYAEDGKHGLLTYSLRKPSLSAPDDFWLLFAYAFSKWIKNAPDVHSGYFHANAVMTRRLIYGLASLGWDPLLKTMYPNVSDPMAELNTDLTARWLQVMFAPKEG